MNLRIKRIKELFGYAFKLLREDGLFTMIRRGMGFVRRRFFSKRARYLPKSRVLVAQRDLYRQLHKEKAELPLISICVPLYNTPDKFLYQFLDSVLAQTSEHWQLCLADASDAEHPQVAQIVEEKIHHRNGQPDSRILYKKVENLGISANTNAAATMATGEYLALADHDDLLAPHAVFMMQKAILEKDADFLYSDEALFKKTVQRPMVGHFKPDYAPDYLLCCNYICHLAVFRRSLFEAVGGERPECDGSQDHDLFLRLLEKTTPDKIVHIPHVLYYWRVHEASTSGGVEAKPYVAEAAKRAITEHLERTGQKGTVTDGLFPSTYRVVWDLPEEPLVSILIPSKDHIDDLEKCLSSIYAKTEYKNFEVIVIENNSTDKATFDYYQQLEESGRYPGCKVVYYKAETGFNFSAINNFGRKAAKGEYILLLNNDVEVITPEWLTELVRQASRPGAAACGAMLYYPDDTVQHAGIITGLGGFAGHSHKYHKRGGSGYMFRMGTVQDFSACTAACLLVRASVYDELEGLDENYAVAFNDVDFCLRIREKGYRILWSPYAQLYHYESKSRGLDEKDKEKKARFSTEQQRLLDRFGRGSLLKDPYYNPSLTLDREDFSESADLRNLQEIM